METDEMQNRRNSKQQQVSYIAHSYIHEMSDKPYDDVIDVFAQHSLGSKLVGYLLLALSVCLSAISYPLRALRLA